MSASGCGLNLVVMVFLTVGCGEAGHSGGDGTNTTGTSTGEITSSTGTPVPTGATGPQPTNGAPSTSTTSNMSRSEETSGASSSETLTYSCETTCSRSVGCPNDTTERTKECVELCNLYEGLCPSESADLHMCGAELDDVHFACNAEGRTAIADGSCMKEGDQLLVCVLAASMN